MRNNVISTNKTRSNILNKENIGNIKSIFENVGIIVANALLTAVITELEGSASGRSENIFTKIVSIRLNIAVIRYH